MAALADLFSRSDEGAFAVDANSQVTLWNPACEDLLGIPARRALGRPCHEVLHTCDGAGQPFCGPGCRLAPLVRGGAAPRAEPIWFVQDANVRRKLWLSVFLMPSQWANLWTVVHLLQREPPPAVPLVAGRSEAGGRRHGSPEGPRRQTGSPHASRLTAREREILVLLAEGSTTAAISRDLSISPVTVRNHIQHLMAKLGAHSKLEVVAYAYRNHLVAAPRLRESAQHFAGKDAR